MLLICSCDRISLFFITGKPYVNDAHGIYMKYPDNWTVNDNGVMGSVVVFINRADSEKIKPTVNVFVREANGNSLAQFVNRSKRGMESEIKSIGYKLRKFTDQGRAKLGIYDAYQQTYLYEQAGEQYMGRAYYYIKDGLAYLLFCTADEKNFPSYESDFSVMVRSFRIR